MQTDIAAGHKISNISYGDSEAGIILIYGGFLAKVLQYISKGGREMAICVAIYKNEGAKGKAKAIVASAVSTHVRLSFYV